MEYMGKALIIAEKPSVAGDIAKALGGFKKQGDYFESEHYLLSSAVGHLLELCVSEEFELLDEAFLTDEDTKDVFVALSHDGVQPAHDAHRRDPDGADTFDRLSPKVDLLLKHKPYAPVMSVVNPDTVLSAGEIAGLATIPEPSALILLASGLFGLLAYAWRKRK